MPTIDSDLKGLIKDTYKGVEGKIWAATVAKVYRADPRGNEWMPQAKAGALLFLRDGRDNMFLRLVDIAEPKAEQCRTLWEHELYLDFQYRREEPYFYSFESDNCQFGLLFCDQREAADFAKHVSKRLSKLGRGMGETASISSQASAVSGTKRSSSFFGSLFSSSSKDKSRESVPSSPVNAKKTEEPPTATKSPTKRIGKIQEDDIGDPIAFQHLSHIGFNPQTGVWDMKNIPTQWRRFFEAAGVGKEELESKETAGFIAEFVKTAHVEGRVAAGKKGPPPPPPTKGSKPKVPARFKEMTPVEEEEEVPRKPTRKPIDERLMQSRVAARPTMSKSSGPPPPPPPSFADFKAFQQERNHHEEIEEVEKAPGKTSRPAPGPPKPSLHDELLQSIRAAALTDLKPLQRSETSASLSSTISSPSTESAPGDAMAALLAQAMKARKKAVAHSDSEEEEEW